MSGRAEKPRHPHRLWGGQSCPQPAFRPAGPTGKRVRRLKSLPHSEELSGIGHEYLRNGGDRAW